MVISFVEKVTPPMQNIADAVAMELAEISRQLRDNIPVETFKNAVSVSEDMPSQYVLEFGRAHKDPAKNIKNEEAQPVAHAIQILFGQLMSVDHPHCGFVLKKPALGLDTFDEPDKGQPWARLLGKNQTDVLPQEIPFHHLHAYSFGGCSLEKMAEGLNQVLKHQISLSKERASNAQGIDRR